MTSVDLAAFQPQTVMGYEAARELTAELRDALALSGSLLLEAYERRAYIALGYATWADYVRRELSSALTSVQRRLDHTRLVRAVEAMGVPPRQVPDVPLTMAAPLLRHLDSLEELPDDPVAEITAVLASLRARRDEVDDHADLVATATRLAPTIEKASARVGMSASVWLDRVIDAATRIAGCD